MKTAVVIGGSGGIGRASAAVLAERGFESVIVTFNADDQGIQQTLDEVRANGGAPIPLRLDVSDPLGVIEFASVVHERSNGRIDALVYAAGYRYLAPTLSFDADWTRAVDVSLLGFVRSVQALSPSMVAGGKIVGVSGLSGLRAYSSEHMVMGTVKAASQHAMTYLAWELARRGVNLNMACFGAVLTDGVKRDLTSEQYLSFVEDEGRSERVPLGILPTATDVAKVVAFLCSDDASLIVGQIIVADGGETLR